MFFSGLSKQENDVVDEEEAPNYEEKAQEIVQSILQEVVNTVVGGNLSLAIYTYWLYVLFF